MQYRWRTEVDYIDTTYGEKLSEAGDKINTFVYNISSDYYQFVNTFQDARANQIVNVPFSKVDSTVMAYLTGEFQPDFRLMQNLLLEKYEQVPVDIRLKLIRWYFEPWLLQQKSATNNTARAIYLDSSTGLFKFANNRALYNNYSDTTGVIGNIYPLNAITPLSGSFDLIINGLFYDFGHTPLKPGEVYHLSDDLDGWLIPYSEGGKGNNISLPFAVAISPQAGVLLTDRAITKELPCYPICPPRELKFQKEIVPTPTPTPTAPDVECTVPAGASCEEVGLHLQQTISGDIVNKSDGPRITTNTGVTYTKDNKLYNEWTLDFDGSSHMSIPYSPNSPFAFTSGDFTVEFWIYSKSQPSNTCILHNSKNVLDNTLSWGWMVLYTGGRLMFGYSPTGKAGTGTNNSWKFPLDTITPVVDEWHHVAFVRKGDALFGYLDGVLVDQSVFNGDAIFNPSQPLEIGRRDSADSFTGQLQDVRISNKAIYEGDCFTMPGSLLPITRPLAIRPDPCEVDFLLQPTSTSDINNTLQPVVTSGNLEHVATPDIFSSGSVHFTGVSGYMSVGNSDSFNFLRNSTNDYTIDIMLQVEALTGRTCIFSNCNAGDSTAYGSGLYLYEDAANDLKVLYILSDGNTGTLPLTLQSQTIPVTDLLYHVAVTNHSGTFSLYINGTREDTSTINHNSDNEDSSHLMHIGIEPSLTNGLSGYIQSFQITRHDIYEPKECIDYPTSLHETC